MFRDIDRDQVIVPTDIKFPLAVVDYLAWKEPSGHRTFLVLEDKASGRPFAMTFERTKNTEAVPMMCNWCHAVRPASDVALMTAAVTKRKRVGLYLCSDISCKSNVLDKPSVHDMRETLDKTEKTIRLNQKIHNFINREIL
ncbi:MAG: FBP domain-containing protein [Bdellovibrionales bacterium]|nr:FBP domain-containing protein [Bdellovibrionales bacterium]